MTDTPAPVTPRTEAGRAMVDYLDGFDDEAEVRLRVSAIEREAAAPAATEALRAALERLERVVSHPASKSDEGPNGGEIVGALIEARAALASSEPTPDSGLDVERLRRAMYNTMDDPSASVDAELVAAEYARLLSADSPEESA